MIYRLLAYWISFIFPTFYKRIQIKNLHHLRRNVPIIIAMNHPNAFTDPVGLSYLAYPLRFKFLARGDAFKGKIVAWLLDQIGIIPIYRIQDGGKAGLHKNEETYNRVNAYLKQNAKVIVFAEGLCIMERRLRPLKKGVARMVFGAYDFLNDERLLVVPVGVNYSRPDKIRSDLFYNVGEPIVLKDFLKDKGESQVKNQNAFLQYLEPRLKELITHIENPENDDLVVEAELLCKKEWLKKQGLNAANLEHDFEVRKQITEKINRFSEINPVETEGLRVKSSAYFRQLTKLNFNDELLSPDAKKFISYPQVFIRVLFLLAGLPFFAIGYISNYIPTRTTFALVNKVVKNKEFFSSFTIAFAMLMFLFYYSLLYTILSFSIGSKFLALVTIVCFMLSAWFNLYYLPFFTTTKNKLFLLRNKTVYANLETLRADLMATINKL